MDSVKKVNAEYLKNNIFSRSCYPAPKFVNQAGTGDGGELSSGGAPGSRLAPQKPDALHFLSLHSPPYFYSYGLSGRGPEDFAYRPTNLLCLQAEVSSRPQNPLNTWTANPYFQGSDIAVPGI